MAHGTKAAPPASSHPAPRAIEIPPRVGGPGSNAFDQLHGRLGIHPVLLLIVAFGLIYPLTASDYWVNNVTEGLVLAISALGLLVVVGWGREISLAQAGLTGSALYISGYLSRGDAPGIDGPGLPFPLAAAGGIAFAVVVSVLVALVAMRLSGVYVIVLTLSLQFLIENSLFTEAKLTGGLSPLETPRPEFFGASLTCPEPCSATLSSDDRIYYFILSFLLVSMVFLYRFRNSRFGRSMIMVGVDKAAAAAVGVSPWKYKVAAFAIAGGFAGLGGALLAPKYGSPPGVFEYNAFNSLFYLSIPIMAGFESLMAVVAIALLFRLTPQIFLELQINPYLLGGVGLALGVLVGPRGVGGAIADLFDSRARAKRKGARGGGGGSSGRRATSSSGAPPGGDSAKKELKVPAAAGAEQK